MSLDPETRSAIESLVTENHVVLFMKGTPQQPQCGFSAKAVAALDMLVPDYSTVDVLQHAAIREGIKLYGNWPTIPQLYVAGELVGGSDIVLEMMQTGELADLLGVKVPDPGTPQIQISDSAAEVMRNAAESRADMAIHLQIDAGWQHTMSLSQPSGSGVKVAAGGVEIHMDPWTAARANGLRIGLQESLQGTHFGFDNPNAPPPVNQISVHELKARLDSGDEVHLFDVRSDEERAQARIEAARPFDREAFRLIGTLAKDAELIFHCHSGGRSQAAAEQLRRRGYTNLHNVTGGIRAWSEDIDPEVPTY